jgi:hypothetical protein
MDENDAAVGVVGELLRERLLGRRRAGGRRLGEEGGAAVRPAPADERVQPQSSEHGCEEPDEIASTTPTPSPPRLLDQRLLVEWRSVVKARGTGRKGDAHACRLITMKLL